MRKRIYVFILTFLILSAHSTVGKKENVTNSLKGNHKKHSSHKENAENDRAKRSLYDDEKKPFWTNRGKKDIVEGPYHSNIKYYSDDLQDGEKFESISKFENEPPFWGTRGRRDSTSTENLVEKHYPMSVNNLKYLCKNNKNCYKYESYKERRDEQMSPFWGNRGRRASDEVEESEPFWGNRGRRQDNEPFWGTRGRREDDSPFWANRGRRDEAPFWGNRGRRQDSPFWGARGRREEIEPFWGAYGRREDEPFWGNRGRRQESEPFWGARGRREDSEPFWANRGRREDSEPFWGNRGRRKADNKIKENILEAINNVEGDIEILSRLRRSSDVSNMMIPHTQYFWGNRGRDSKLKHLFNGSPGFKSHLYNKGFDYEKNTKSYESSTVLNDKMFADEPFYIVVERSSRSSREADDPYFISRGKKKNGNHNLAKAVRGRRGALEEIVKSVRNDPYYIARGKKDSDESNVKVGNSTELNKEFVKAKELICSTIDLMMIKNEQKKSKREVGDKDRDRRTILKNLAAQLQMDPYFVSRGKRDGTDQENLQNFIEQVAEMCD